MTVQEAIKWLKHPRHSANEVSERLEAIQIAIVSMEKQIPKKPLVDSYGEIGMGFLIPLCPCCQEPLEEGEHHCKCGQKLDWEEGGTSD